MAIYRVSALAGMVLDSPQRYVEGRACSEGAQTGQVLLVRTLAESKSIFWGSEGLWLASDCRRGKSRGGQTAQALDDRVHQAQRCLGWRFICRDATLVRLPKHGCRTDLVQEFRPHLGGVVHSDINDGVRAEVL